MRRKEIGQVSSRADFLRYVCQTSSEPIGIEVDRAEGCWIKDRSGKKYLDFISGIVVANLGHATRLWSEPSPIRRFVIFT